MALMSSPTEIISLILEAVGAAEFHAQIDRLTVCKAWYDIAMPIFLKHLTLDFISLKQIPPTSNTNRLLAAYSKALSVNLQSFEAFANDELFCSPSRNMLDSHSHADNLQILNSYNSKRNERVQILASLLPNLTSLDYFSSQIGNESDSELLPNSSSYQYLYGWLYNSTMTSLLVKTPTTHLTTLILDIRGSIDMSDLRHVCPLIALSLSTLHRLHLRLHTICPDAVKIKDLQKTPRLKNIVVNLSLRDSYGLAAHGVPKKNQHCGLGRKWLNNYTFMNEAMYEIVMRIPDLKIVRILYEYPNPHHSYYSFNLAALDCITHRKSKLQDNILEQDG